MSLKELKRLAPWQWESKVATKKHKIGPKGLQEWEQIQRAIVGADCDADGCGGSGGPRDKSGGSKRLRNKDSQSAAVPPSPDASALDLTTPGHPTTKKRSPQQAASTAAAAADLDPSADKAPEAPACPSTALKRDTTVAKTPAGTTSKTPAAVRLGVQTPALAILGKAFSPSPYAPTPVPYGGLKACSNLPAAAAAQTRMTRTHSSSTSGSTYGAADAAAPAAAGSASGSLGSSSARLAASSDAAAAARMAAPGSSRSGGARATAGLTSGTPVPKFSLTSPAMLPPASKPLGTSGTATQQQVAATPAPGGNKRAPAAAVTPATAPGAVLSGAGAVLQRSNSMQSSAAGRAAQTPRVLAGLPSLSALLAAASGPGGCSPAAAAAGTDATYLPAAAGEGDATGDQAAMLDCSADDEEECAGAGAMAIDELLQEAAEHQATGAAGDADTLLLHEVSPKESDVSGGQHSLPPAALATPAPQVIEALPGAAAASTAAAMMAPMAADTNSRDLQRISPLSTSSGSSAAAGNPGAPAAQQQQEAGKLSSPNNTPDTAATAAAGESVKASTPAATLPGTSGTTNVTSSSGGGSASGGSSGGSSAGGGGGGRALSVISLKKLWRESHAAAMAAAAAAAAAAGDAANTSSGAAEAARGADTDSPVAAAAGPSERVEAAAAGKPKETSLEPQAAAAAAAAADEGLRERSPDTLAVARCADLLLLAAAAEEADGAAAAAASAADDANNAEGTPPADAEDDGRLADAAATLAAAAAAVEAPAAAAAAAAAPQGLKVASARARRSTNPQSKVAAARVAVSAVMPRQPHAVHAAALQRRHHLDTMPMPTVRPHVRPAPSAVSGAAAAAAGAAAGGGSAVCGGVSGGQLVSNCSSSLMLPPAAQMRLLHLQQQRQGVGSAAAPVALSRFHPVPAANARVPHVQNPGQMPPPRTSHTGVYLQSPRQLNSLAPETLNPAGGLQGSCWTTGGPEQQQQQAVCGATAAEVGTAGVSGAAAANAEAVAAAARPSAAASGAARALSSLCGGSALGSSCSLGTDAVRLDIAPLQVPPLLSDAECWRLAQSQPWLIEAVAAGARQLLSGSMAAGPAATGAVGALGNKAGSMGRVGKAAGSVAGAAAKQDRSYMVGAAAADSWGGYNCSGVQGPTVAGAVRPSAPPQKQKQRQAFGARVLQERNC